MKVEINNLGVIKQAEIDLKPLTVFIGNNGEGKTWAAYTLSAILGSYGYVNYQKAYFDGKNQQTYPPLDGAIDQIINEGNAQINLIQFAKEYGELYINDVARLVPNWMQSFLGTERVNFENLQVIFKLEESKQVFFERLKSASIERKLSSGILNALKESGEEILFFYTETEGNVNDKLPLKAIRQFVIKEIFQTIHRTFYANELYIFPTERTTFITFPFGNIIDKQKMTKNDRDDSEINESELGKTPLPGPVSHFLGTMLNASRKSMSIREEEIKENPRLDQYVKLANLLEDYILQGKLGFETSKLRKELLFQPTVETKLEMPIVSSMVKELAPLFLCLRDLVKPNEWLIIDEPEMNLHPAAQVRIIEFLVMLVNAGLHVLITTHSPYIVDHLANLMQGAKHDNPESIKELFYLEKTESFIAQEKVGVYLFEEGTAKNILNDEGIINWETFGNVSNDLSGIYSQLL